MAEQKQPITDPFTAWRSWLDQTERQINSFFNKFMSSEQYNRAMAQFNDFTLNTQKSLNDAASRYFSSLNLPTREDFAAMGERVAALEGRLHKLEGNRHSPAPAPEANRPASANAPRPPRTRKPSGNHKP